jgi:hypothetical protein
MSKSKKLLPSSEGAFLSFIQDHAFCDQMRLQILDGNLLGRELFVKSERRSASICARVMLLKSVASVLNTRK